MTAALRAAIAELGMTEMGAVYDRMTREFGTQALQFATSDAAIVVSDIVGLLINAGAPKTSASHRTSELKTCRCSPRSSSTDRPPTR